MGSTTYGMGTKAVDAGLVLLMKSSSVLLRISSSEVGVYSDRMKDSYLRQQ
jgi:hypothetical protein